MSGWLTAGEHRWARLFRVHGHTIRLHRTRQGFVTERTATYNRLRGLLSEFGIVLPPKVTGLRTSIGKHLDALPGYAKRCIEDLLTHARKGTNKPSDGGQASPVHCMC